MFTPSVFAARNLSLISLVNYL